LELLSVDRATLSIFDDLCFHDLRHEGTSRLFEAGFLDTAGCDGDGPQGLADAQALYKP
jgi:hypothetical protein